MEKFVIEDGISMDEAKANGSSIALAIKSMAVGQSFFIPKDRFDKSRSSVYSAAKYVGRTIAVRKVDGGVRVWRIG